MGTSIGYPASSADPDALSYYAHVSKECAIQLAHEQRLLAEALRKFASGCTEYGGCADPSLADEMNRYGQGVESLGEWVRHVGETFRRDDTGAASGQRTRFVPEWL
jgi:hypothetical protein